MSDAAAAIGQTETAGPPDWSTIKHDVLCPLCEYNLRGLNTPRCPECGYHFEWKEVLDPRRREHPYLFEHHPEDGWWSFRRTALGALKPKRFWTSLHPVQRSRPRRLLLYWFAGMAAFAVAAVVLLTSVGVMEIVRVHVSRARLRSMLEDPRDSSMQQQYIQMYGSVTAMINAYEPVPPTLPTLLKALRGQTRSDFTPLVWLELVLALVWPLATFAALMIFRWSMRRARINTTHVVRCVVYSYDTLPASIVILAQALLISCAPLLGQELAVVLLVVLLLLLGALFVFNATRLWRAYQLYLRFDRPLATVLASQLIVSLLALNIVAIGVLWH
jgi:hypothetical protein